MSWINPDYECRKNLIESAIEDIETYLQEMEDNCTEWEISYDYSVNGSQRTKTKFTL